jgi:hypothetical protein
LGALLRRGMTACKGLHCVMTERRKQALPLGNDKFEVFRLSLCLRGSGTERKGRVMSRVLRCRLAGPVLVRGW